MIDEPQTTPLDDEPPPFLGSWKNLYLAVIIYLVALVLILGFISRWLNQVAS